MFLFIREGDYMRKRIFFLGVTIWTLGLQVFFLILWILAVCMILNGKPAFDIDSFTVFEKSIFAGLLTLNLFCIIPYWIDFIFFRVKVIKGNAYEYGNIGSSRSFPNGVGAKIQVTDEDGKKKKLRMFHEVLKYSLKDNTDMPFQKYNYAEIYYLPCTRYIIYIKFYKKKQK